MKSFFGWLTGLSIRFRAVTIALALTITVLGIVAITQLQQELIPPVEFPQSFIFSQVSGMESEEVLAVLTTRLERALAEIGEIVNLESTTTGSFGSLIITRNEFGIDQERLKDNIRAAIDTVWLPIRRIQPAAGQDPQVFASQLLNDLTPDILIYLAEADPNFLFQLSPDVWASLSDATVQAVLAYLAGQTEETQNTQSALESLVEQEIVPQLERLDVLADISVSGGQALPGDENAALTTAAPVETQTANSLLLKLSAEVWDVVSARITGLGALDQSAVDTLRQMARQEAVEIPTEAPPLPASWQIDGFSDASDLLEMRSLLSSLATVFNSFRETGQMAGALGQTNDLTPEIVTRMLEIAPTMVNHFKAEHLAAMPPEVFAVLPDDFIAGLDGFTRDELAAAALAESITGRSVTAEPVTLPSAWCISPPQLISFSMDDLPLATFSIFGTDGAAAVETASAASNPPGTDSNPEGETPIEAANSTGNGNNIPVGPPLPPVFALLGLQFGTELNTADDLIHITLPESMAEQLGGASSLRAADLFNFMMMLRDPAALPEGVQMPAIPLDIGALIGSISPEAIAFIAEYDPTFLTNLSPDVFEVFSDAVLAQPQIAPPLPDVWDTLSGQPEFDDMPLRSSRDVLELGSGQASQVLNVINAEVPERFSGYEVRLLDSLTPANIRYFAAQEEGFFANLDLTALRKFSPEALSLLPDDFLASLNDDTAGELRAIASGEQSSAAAALAERYALNVPEADPAAPPIAALWAQVGNFYGIEMDTADDFFRFPPDFFYPTPADFMNSIFDSAQGRAVAPDLFGGLSADAIAYMIGRETAVLDTLRVEGLQLLPEDAQALLPVALQERARSGGNPFTPTETVTRLDGFPSLLLTVYKTSESNTVEAFHRIDDVLEAINAADDRIDIAVSFEQSSFIEESISGVAREGGLGAIFAVIVILGFLSSGVWDRSPRQITGMVLIGLFLVLLLLVVLAGLGAAGGEIRLAFEQADAVVRVLLLGGAVVGLLILLWPRNVPRPAWRSTLVTGISIPLSILMALAFMRWVPPLLHGILAAGAADSPILFFLTRLFPKSITINIMTLSGLTVAIGRVVDDSIVVLENIVRQMQEGGDRRAAVVTGTRDVSVAIFAATAVTVVVFLPLGLTGGIIGEIFLPFGLAVTFALGASFIVAITVVPVLAYMLISDRETIGEQNGWIARLYLPVLRWSLSKRRNQIIVLALAAASMVAGVFLFSRRPAAFLPDFGEPQISVAVSMPSETHILETNALVEQFERAVREEAPAGQIGRIQTVVGGGGLSMASILGTNSSVSENIATITLGVESPNWLDTLTPEIRAIAERIFGQDNVTVSGGSFSSQALGGFALVLAGPQEDLMAINAQVLETLNHVGGIANISSNLSQISGAADDGPITYIRVDQVSAVRYTGDLETENAIGVVQEAIEALQALPNLPPTVTISQGFESEIQTQGFNSLFTAMGIAVVIVIGLLIVTFGSLVHWLDIMLSVIVAPVGAAVALTLTSRALGISAMIGLLMLIGIVVTNAVVLIDRVMTNRRARQMPTQEALIEAGGRRLRPILMTALATIFALIPLAVGLSEGAIIASELGTVVIGGLFSSTLLTLIVVPVAYSILNPLHERLSRLINRKD